MLTEWSISFIPIKSFPSRSTLAILEATMNINLDFCANSDKKISPNDNLGTNFPKSKSCQRITFSPEVNDHHPLEEDNLEQINNDKNQVRLMIGN